LVDAASKGRKDEVEILVFDLVVRFFVSFHL
jgi:ankyrin repeat protein